MNCHFRIHWGEKNRVWFAVWLEINSYIRGYVPCLQEPTVGEILLVKMEPNNLEKIGSCSCMIKDGEVVGYAPATKIFQFLRRDMNKAFQCWGDWDQGSTETGSSRFWVKGESHSPLGFSHINSMESQIFAKAITPEIFKLLEKCKTLRGEPELIMSCTHDSLKFLGAKWNLLNNKWMTVAWLMK